MLVCNCFLQGLFSEILLGVSEADTTNGMIHLGYDDDINPIVMLLLRSSFLLGLLNGRKVKWMAPDGDYFIRINHATEAILVKNIISQTSTFKT